MLRPAFPIALALFCLLGSVPAQAGLFDDDVARKQISDLEKSTSQLLIDQSRLTEQINREVAELRGHIESTVNQVGLIEKRQKDLYMDIDNRLQPLESNKLKSTLGKPSSPSEIPATPTPVEARSVDKVEVQPVVIPQTPPVINAQLSSPPVDPAAALKAYEAALDLFKAGKYKDAANAFNQFGQNYGTSEQAPNAQFWLGNSYYALGECIDVIISQQKLLAKWPTSSRAPDAMGSIATCQAEMGQKAEAQKTLKDLVARYPESKAAATAKHQIK